MEFGFINPYLNISKFYYVKMSYFNDFKSVEDYKNFFRGSK